MHLKSDPTIRLRLQAQLGTGCYLSPPCKLRATNSAISNSFSQVTNERGKLALVWSPTNLPTQFHLKKGN